MIELANFLLARSAGRILDRMPWRRKEKTKDRSAAWTFNLYSFLTNVRRSA